MITFFSTPHIDVPHIDVPSIACKKKRKKERKDRTSNFIRKFFVFGHYSREQFESFDKKYKVWKQNMESVFFYLLSPIFEKKKKKKEKSKFS